jgi:hypothetical protein
MCIIKPEEEVVQLKEKGEKETDTALGDSQVQGGG